MGPGHVLGVADVDHRDAEEAGAGDVELARDPQVRLVEALRAAPGEVRVGEHHAAAVGGRLAAEAPAVGARGAEARVERRAELGDVGAVGRGRGGARRGRWRGVGDPVLGDLARGELAELVEAPVGVHLGDLANPGGAGAGRIGEVVDPGLVEVAVVALDVAGDRLLDRGLRAGGRRRRGELLDDPARLDPRVEEVGLEVGVALGRVRVGAEVARALGVRGHVGLGDRADVVGGERVAVAEAEALVVVGGDRRDPALAAHDLRLQPLRRRARGDRGHRRDGRQPCADQAPESCTRHPCAHPISLRRGAAARRRISRPRKSIAGAVISGASPPASSGARTRPAAARRPGRRRVRARPARRRRASARRGRPARPPP